MGMGYRSAAAGFVVLVSALVFTTSMAGAPAPGSSEAKIQALQKQVDEISQELARLQGTDNQTAQQHAMQRHWSMMQGYMGSVRQMPGMGAYGASGWMMMDPWMMRGGMMGPGMMNGSMKGWMGCCGGTGGGASGWPLPSGVTPDAYQRQMRNQMQTMHVQMAAIAAETDPARRATLMREHYESMYRNMQTMRGMGWMWAPNVAASLPDAASPGAKVLMTYCTQCHAAPSPTLHTAPEWEQVIPRMRAHMKDSAAGSGVATPSDGDLQTLGRYFGEHARTN